MKFVSTGASPHDPASAAGEKHAGDQGFATQVNGLSPAPVAVINQYGAIPHAWASLSSIDGFYPWNPLDLKNKPGPVARAIVTVPVSILNSRLGSNVFVQPDQQPALNSDYSVFDPEAVGGLTSGPSVIAQQILFQHSGNTYLTLLEATPIPASAPVVTSISPTSGASAGGTQVTITGTGFTSDSVVDFGTLPGASVTVVSDTQITVTSPAMVGTADVQVTNMFGTSPASAADRFTTPLSGG